MKKILIVCGNGLGSSFIVEMNVKKIIKELGKEAEVSHTDLSSAKSEAADIYIGSSEIIANLDDGNRKVFGLNNLLDNAKIKEILANNL
ncbi:PTS sugar transporter subunit IIB [Rouxiella badensis]|jgi:PTS system ascorbate-specific IIB component|uniref:PTS lactose transporter subunit IIB n=1 Tax=Rouxiella badensis TaxID=1646377 RepID=A0A1X0WEZ1_9GAMM|nr:PTS sugar transporter subunit IIB [Rouxiella badensis]MCC3703813.1 PTS sugar transporter subunit IIB [Rouxiella badensis]MCC3719841.1 PTS sugar transporter subunit IIB [Rouxiella badensis]MCC3729307.1 PTS sugar transporter subunit IIB [Rouxiella badensis]MCC3734723.1 PTS sugar transporter subunit IIB [Rouxiella badensis]MCC3741474.1 PTS sugar transporter subunit IIB [Rouxiella badensis]